MEIPLVEHHAVLDIYVAGVAKIEPLSGGMARIIYYVEEREPDGGLVHVVVAKLVRPMSTLIQSMRLFEDVFSTTGVVVQDGRTGRMM